MTRKLIFIRHSISKRVPGTPANTWGLTEEGQALCLPLGKKLAQYELSKIYASEERKAYLTAQLAAEPLGIPVETYPGLHEHERASIPYYPTQEEFLAAVQRFFKRPDELVLGEETANKCLARFDEAVTALIGREPTGNIAIASHGTVISLFVAKYNDMSIIPFWRGLQMPDMVVLDLPGFQIRK
jgi:broad specificity phosphatase PhoE